VNSPVHQQWEKHFSFGFGVNIRSKRQRRQQMKGKICMVTGASSGIGKAIAVKLAAMGATVVAVCRDQAHGQSAVDDIKRASRSDAVELMVVELSSQASIRQLAADYKRAHDKLHVLVNNAGVNLSTYSKTVDGIETTFAVNHLAPFLLTNLLIERLQASAPARVVNITSAWQGLVNFDDLMGEKLYKGQQAYTQSKTANVLFTYELARRLKGTGVTVNCVSPGFVRTRLGRDTKGFFKVFLAVMRPLMASPDKGAETPVYVATAPELEGVTGKYFDNKTEKRSSEATYDESAAQRLWQISAELTGLQEALANKRQVYSG
jgi:NAD(P)-dependent dehydrogenase (short-subunit alcohol dehydrogenase family)